MDRFKRLVAVGVVAFVATFPARTAAQDATAPPDSSAPAESTSAPAESTSTPAEGTSAPADTTSAPADAPSAPADATSAPAGGSPAPAADGGPDNTAVAINTKDGTDLFRLAFSINRVMSENRDDPDNAAVAFSSCEACETTAIAIQVVIMTTPPDGESPTNLAIAINEQCTSCETVALAYQLVLYTDGPVKLTKDGKERIKDIVDRLRALEDEDLTPAELDARTGALVDELAVVLNEELEPKSTGNDKDSESEVGDVEPSDTLPSPGMTTSPEDGVDLGEDEPSPASDAPTTTEPTADASASPAAESPASTSPPEASP